MRQGADVNPGQQTPQRQRLNRVVIRFAGDSGDGMQLTGDRFGAESAEHGNDIATLPDYPAEIRAPQGTIAGVSSFQIQFADEDIVTPGEHVDVLVAMNPAALRANLADVVRGGLVIVDKHSFAKRALEKAGYQADPLTDGSLEGYQLVEVDITTLTATAVSAFETSRRGAARSRNMFALGLVSWLYGRPTEDTVHWLGETFASRPSVRDANIAALRAGENYGENTEQFAVRYEVPPAPVPAGRYRRITGNLATAYGLMVGAARAGMTLFVGSYPITPASDILHELSKRKAFGVITVQAEDEIAGIGAALGASLGGALGVTTTSGPGFALKQEMINLAVMTELPLVIVDVQRSGPSTGMPTKTEQGDLLQALWGRNGESPLPVFAPSSPSDCFQVTVDACRAAVENRTPVVLLTDAFLANGAEPWQVPDLSQIAPIDPHFATGPNGFDEKGKPTFLPYKRDPQTLARDWALPGTVDAEHRLGGLEKSVEAGTVSYDPANHEQMVHTRAERVARIPVPDALVDDPEGEADLLVVGWGSSWGPITAAVRDLRAAGRHVAQVQLRTLNPLPANLDQVLHRYRRVIAPEVNLGQLALVLRAKYLVDVRTFSKVRGQPLPVGELTQYLAGHLDEIEQEARR
ncbi:2-oxoacid:acceptor oxidoreductase subunit alpha [Propionibacterium freudenreichii]|uniref:2-oxoacid:acceptor oxidoreductase subunit alpha n=1 Tax=Propionibacterium freudenreichii TaxID=1744 RepID=UPI000BEF1032|nr:2-oxoacid:acceptor oxidoreductase subunit alpha [Propionibacterium freudenreichii]MDK9592775.1 2-oxoacid:acceptor oxidoreductase subunit alpha [Propionibacterium freudenreichii]WFF33604.1 2-oxoacid:acceptor oxidoreductase subunit alpha [Propionibacterium freudenreichii]WFF35835.1 2-oxoacid:acceptor oxidoreductase subunit alpha [Propionibacterium freudenreichii]